MKQLIAKNKCSRLSHKSFSFSSLVATIFTGVIAASLSTVADAQKLEFLQHGKIVLSTDAKDLIKRVGENQIEVWDPHEQKAITYRAIPTRQLLEQVYGDKWQERGDEVLVTCSDGYQPVLPMERFTDSTGYLAFAREGSRKFSLINKILNSKKIDLAPYYLIWPEVDSKRDGENMYWPYQVAKLDIIRFADRFPRIAPPSGTSEAEKRGFIAFRTHCLKCHSLNGEGGVAGPELNFPMNVTEYYQPTFLKKWISDPLSVRYRTIMPALDRNLKNREEVIEDIVSYLKKMKQRKLDPKSEPKRD